MFTHTKPSVVIGSSVVVGWSVVVGSSVVVGPPYFRTCVSKYIISKHFLGGGENF